MERVGTSKSCRTQRGVRFLLLAGPWRCAPVTSRLRCTGGGPSRGSARRVARFGGGGRLSTPKGVSLTTSAGGGPATHRPMFASRSVVSHIRHQVTESSVFIGLCATYSRSSTRASPDEPSDDPPVLPRAIVQPTRISARESRSHMRMSPDTEPVHSARVLLTQPRAGRRNACRPMQHKSSQCSDQRLPR